MDETLNTETPHFECPNILEDFDFVSRAKNCLTCLELGKTCRGLKHPRREMIGKGFI